MTTPENTRGLPPRILIVEDEAVSRTVLHRMLRAYGQCEIACDGKEGLDLFMSGLKEGNPFTVMFVDVALPQLDGRELLRLVRKAEEERGCTLASSVKVVMATTNGEATSILGSFKEGAEGYVLKPFDLEKVQKLLAKLGITPTTP